MVAPPCVQYRVVPSSVDDVTLCEFKYRAYHHAIDACANCQMLILGFVPANRCTPQLIAMAEAPDPSDKRLEELEEEITCAVCHGHYQEAKLLPCMHYYCRACIEKLAERSRGRPFPCPECRKDTALPSGGAEKLQGAFFVERMKDLHGKMAKAEGKVEAVCESCFLKRKAIAFCRQCTAFLCAHCVEQHKTLRAFAGHKVDTLEDLKKGGALDIPLKEAPPPKCPEHDEPMKIFCFDCNHLICRDCILYDHREHKSDFVKKCAAENRKSLRKSLIPLRKVQAHITGADKKLVATEAQVEAQEKEVCQTIKRSFAQLKAILEQRETELLNKAVTLAREKKDTLTAQRKGLQMAETEIQTLVEFVERNVENTSDQDLMVIRTQLQAKMEEEEKRHQQLSLEPATTADITYDPPPPDTIPRDLGEVLRLNQIPQVCEIGDLLSIQLGKMSKMMTLKAPGHQNSTIRAELISLVDPATSVQADVVQKGVGLYNITCTPRVRGRHDLTVKVNGKNIVGSPFQVFVKIHPTQLGPPVRTISGVSSPWEIALNSKQQLDTQLAWYTPCDYADGVAKAEKLALRFKQSAPAAKFHEVFKGCVTKATRDKDTKEQSPPSLSPTTVTKPAESLSEKFSRPAGSWECDTCLVQNQPAANKCVACGSRKPGAQATPDTQSLLAKFAPPAGSWACDVCLVQNQPSLDKCVVCGSSKPEEDLNAMDGHETSRDTSAVFVPLVSLPQLEEIHTGEEDEEVLFCHRAKLYRFDVDTKAWKERGLGDIKILQHKETGKARILMRRKQVLKLCCNHYIMSDMSLTTLKGDTQLAWYTPCDYADGIAKVEKLAVRFKQLAPATKFREVFKDCVTKAMRDKDTKEQSPPSLSPTTVTKPAESLSEKFSRPAGSWVCDTCLVQNQPAANKCVACGSRKPGAQATPVTQSLLAKFAPPAGSWACDVCLVQNQPSSDKCVACRTIRPGSQPPPPMTKLGELATPNFSVSMAPSGQGGPSTRGFPLKLGLPQFPLKLGLPQLGKLATPDISVPPATSTQGDPVTGGFPLKIGLSLPPSTASQEVTAPTFSVPSATSTQGGPVTGGFSLKSVPSLLPSTAPQEPPKSTAPASEGGFKLGGFTLGAPTSSTSSQPSSLFSFKLPTLSPPDEDQEDHTHQTSVHEPDIHFEPIVTLPEAMELKSGEKNEDSLFTERTKLFRFDSALNQWKERGVGEIKILVNRATRRARLLMRRDQVLKICCNHYLTPDMTLTLMAGSSKAWTWFTPCDFADETPKPEKLAASFKSQEVAVAFKRAFEKAVRGLAQQRETDEGVGGGGGRREMSRRWKK